jgi:hypothetical protein
MHTPSRRSRLGDWRPSFSSGRISGRIRSPIAGTARPGVEAGGLPGFEAGPSRAFFPLRAQSRRDGQCAPAPASPRGSPGLTALLPPATSAPGLGSPLPTSAPGLGSPLPTSAPGPGSPLPTSAPGLGSPLPTSAPELAHPLGDEWHCPACNAVSARMQIRGELAELVDLGWEDVELHDSLRGRPRAAPHAARVRRRCTHAPSHTCTQSSHPPSGCTH